MVTRAAGGLAGRRVAVTRAPTQAAELVALLRERGAEPLPYPTIEIRAPASYAQLDAALRGLDRYDWATFTSANAVTAVADRLAVFGVAFPATTRLAAVGAATARVLGERLRAPDFVPRSARAATLAAEIDDVAGRRVLFPHGDLADGQLVDTLRARGALVDHVIAYRTVAGDGVRDLASLMHAGEVDAVLFMSASSVRYVLEALTALGGVPVAGARRPAVICIGPETAAAAIEGGLDVSEVAAQRTASGIVDAAERWFGRQRDVARR
jgi:uroporphyrinogen-III synthase